MEWIHMSDEERKIELGIRRKWGVQIFSGRQIIHGAQNESEFLANRTSVKYALEFEEWFSTLEGVKTLEHIGIYHSLTQYTSRYGDKESNNPSEMFNRALELVTENFDEFEESPIDSPVKYSLKILEEYGYEFNSN